jgi:hypothetical protein
MDTSDVFGAIHIDQSGRLAEMALLALPHRALQVSLGLAVHDNANITLHEDKNIACNY